MAIQFSVTVRNARLDTIESTIGTAPTLEIRTGTAPADCAASDTGTVLATMTLPSDWLAAASSGAKAIAGTWQDASADAGGDAGHFRIKVGGTCHIQGTVTESSGGGDMELQQGTVAIVSGQQVTVTAFTLTDANA
jgi:hypothetical protein